MLVDQWIHISDFVKNYSLQLSMSLKIWNIFYFHNFVYEGVWRNNERREEVINLDDIINKYSSDYKNNICW